MGVAGGLGSVRGVRGLPSSYASSRVAAIVSRPQEAGRARAALRPVRESEVIGPGWTQAVSTDQSKLSADKVRQLQGFDQVLNREQGERIARETFLVS